MQMYAEQKFPIINCLAEPPKQEASREGGELFADILQLLSHSLYILAVSCMLNYFACVSLLSPKQPIVTPRMDEVYSFSGSKMSTYVYSGFSSDHIHLSLFTKSPHMY